LGLGFGVVVIGLGPKPPIPNPQSPIPNPHVKKIYNVFMIIILKTLKYI